VHRDARPAPSTYVWVGVRIPCSVRTHAGGGQSWPPFAIGRGKLSICCCCMYWAEMDGARRPAASEKRPITTLHWHWQAVPVPAWAPAPRKKVVAPLPRQRQAGTSTAGRKHIGRASSTVCTLQCPRRLKRRTAGRHGTNAARARVSLRAMIHHARSCPNGTRSMRQPQSPRADPARPRCDPTAVGGLQLELASTASGTVRCVRLQTKQGYLLRTSGEVRCLIRRTGYTLVPNVCTLCPYYPAARLRVTSDDVPLGNPQPNNDA
jgi:hypothetical protein